MKNLKKILLMATLFLLPSIVFASEINVCNYDTKRGDGTRRVEIWYDVSGRQWKIKYQVANGKSYVTKYGSFAFVFDTAKGNKGPYVWTDGDTKDTLFAFDCPTYAFLDFNGSDELCFSENINSSFCSGHVGKGDMKHYGQADKAIERELTRLKDILGKELYNRFITRFDAEFVDVAGGYSCTSNDDVKKEVENFVADYLTDVTSIMEEVEKNFFEVSDMSVLDDNLKKRILDYSSDISDELKRDLVTYLKKKKGGYDGPISIDPDMITKPIVENNCLNTAINYMIDEVQKTDFMDVDTIRNILQKINISIVIKHQDCDSLLGDPAVEGTPAWYLTKVFNIIKYVAIIILIVLSSMDFFSAITAQDNDALKKAASKALKRFILCVIIWLLPQLIEVILSYIDKIPSDSCIQQ